MAGILQDIGCDPILLNGVEDHVHILCNLSRTVTIAKLVETVKHSPSIWMKEQGPACADFFWQGGYGSFSVSQSNVEQVREYIATQEAAARPSSDAPPHRAPPPCPSRCGSGRRRIGIRRAWVETRVE